MKLILLLLTASLIIAVFLISEDRFFIAGGSDSLEGTVTVNRGVRIASATALMLTILWVVYKPSLSTGLVTILVLGCFVLSLYTVRLSGRSFEVVQSLSVVPIRRFAVIEGEGNLASSVYAGFWPFRLQHEKLEQILFGLARK